MSEVWQIVVQAHSAAEARTKTEHVHGRPRVVWVQDTLESVVRGVEAKRARAEENPALYHDLLVAYDEQERQLYALADSEEPAVMQLITALRIARDTRLEDPERVCAVWVSGDRWVVFAGAPERMT